MFALSQFSARIFAGAAYAILAATGWKKRTVEANLKYVQDVMLTKVSISSQSRGQGQLMLKQAQHDPQQNRNLYKRMLKNLTRHVGELLLCFDTYKRLPKNCSAYPCKVGGVSFELAEGAATVVEKMRGGGIFLTAHYGNYEASGAWLCALGVPLKASFIPLKPAWLNRYIYEKVRCVRGRPYSIDAKTPREFLNLLDGKVPDQSPKKDGLKTSREPGGMKPQESRPRKRELFCLLADQDSRISSALDGTFLGRPAKINPLPDFLLKHRPDTPVFFCWIEEVADQARSVSKKILHAVEAETFQPKHIISSADADLRQHNHHHPENVRGSIVDGAYRSWLEERIRENPALWYGWTHRRFRSKNPEIYG